MAEILHQLVDSLYHYLQGFIHPRWCRISSINSTMVPFSPGGILPYTRSVKQCSTVSFQVGDAVKHVVQGTDMRSG